MLCKINDQYTLNTSHATSALPRRHSEMARRAEAATIHIFVGNVHREVIVVPKPYSITARTSITHRQIHNFSAISCSISSANLSSIAFSEAYISVRFESDIPPS